MGNIFKKRILFFIGSLRSGGKERRLIELLTYLKKRNKYELQVVIKHGQIDYQKFYELGIQYTILKNCIYKKDPTIFYQIYKLCRDIKPNIIHVWGNMPAFYSLPVSYIYKIPLVNSQITSVPPKIKKMSFRNLTNKINFYSSSMIISNSRSGVDAYKPPIKKSRVIHNGINLDRFINLPSIEEIKKKYKLSCTYTVVMVASFTKAKGYDYFINIANRVTNMRDDVIFIGVGDGDQEEYKRIKEIASENKRIVLPGKITDVEALVKACDIGLLFSNKHVHGEGISNAILEYMALQKPVIANDAGGTREVIDHDQNGYLITHESIDEIADMIISLLDNETLRKKMGKQGRRIVEESFTIDKMGAAFEDLYEQLLYGK